MRVFLGAGKVTSILRRPDDVVIPHEQVTILDPDAVLSALAPLPKDTVVINTAAKINLEWCEANPGMARLVNAVGAQNVGKVCKALGLHLVHISSGCIFDGGESPRESFEWSLPNPACVYAATKTEGDLRLLELGIEKLTIVRPRQLISGKPYATNMLTKFASLESGGFIDVPQSVTCIEDLGLMIDHLVNRKEYGVFNCANDGLLSPYQIACAVRDRIAPHLHVSKATYSEYLKTIKVKRVNTVLNIDKLCRTGFTPRDAEDALEDCLINYGKDQ